MGDLCTVYQNFTSGSTVCYSIVLTATGGTFIISRDGRYGVTQMKYGFDVKQNEMMFYTRDCALI